MAKTAIVTGLLLSTLVAHAKFEKDTLDVFKKVKSKVCEGYLTAEQKEELGDTWKGKTVVFAPDVLLNDSHAMYKFPGAEVIITSQVLAAVSEKQNDELLGGAARRFMKAFLSVAKPGSALETKLPDTTTTLKIERDDFRSAHKDSLFNRSKKASSALALAKELPVRLHKDPQDVVLITDDIALQLNAAVMGVHYQPYHMAGVQSLNDVTNGLELVEVTDQEYDAYMEGKRIPILEDKNAPNWQATRVLPNDFGFIYSPSHPPEETAVARCVYDRATQTKSWKKLDDLSKVTGLTPTARNLEQALAFELELDPTVNLVIVVAAGGSGKTFIATAVQDKFHSTKAEYKYFHAVRPMVPFGGFDAGAVPGDMEDKERGYYQPILDSMTALRVEKEEQKSGEGKAKALQPTTDLGFIKWVTWVYLRGITLSYSLTQADEMQNTKPANMWDVVNRIGDGSKLILQGDPGQIDNEKHFLNQQNNGLAVAVSSFRNRNLTDEELSYIGLVRMFEGERSMLNRISNRARQLRGQE